MFRYDGKCEDELSLLPGDILKPLREVEPGWWAALIGEQNYKNSFYIILQHLIKQIYPTFRKIINNYYKNCIKRKPVKKD